MPSSISDRQSVLGRYLAPIALQQFFETYWEKRPLLVHSRDETRFTNLFSIGSIDQIIKFYDLKYPHLRIFRQGSARPFAEFTTTRQLGYDEEIDVIAAEAVVAAIQAKDGITFQFLEKLWEPITHLCSSLQEEVGVRCQANAYLTYPGEQTLDTHYDMHDVIVLHLEGQKHWRVWDNPVSLPMTAPDSEQLKRSVMVRMRSAPLLVDERLRPGDLLYIPRGYVHDAKAADSHALHLTVGLLGERLFSIFASAIRKVHQLAEQEEILRKHFSCLRQKKNGDEVIISWKQRLKRELTRYLFEAEWSRTEVDSPEPSPWLSNEFRLTAKSFEWTAGTEFEVLDREALQSFASGDNEPLSDIARHFHAHGRSRLSDATLCLGADDSIKDIVLPLVRAGALREVTK